MDNIKSKLKSIGKRLAIDFYRFLDNYRVLKIYEKILEESIDKNKLPKHVAIIMDGNRRAAEIYGRDRYYGHYLGAEKVREVLRWTRDLGIKVVTLYAFSTENFKRPKEEVDKLMELFEKKFYEIAEDEEIHEYEVRVRAIGRINLLPKNVQKAIKYAEDRTKNYNKFFFGSIAESVGETASSRVCHSAHSQASLMLSPICALVENSQAWMKTLKIKVTAGKF